MQKKNGQQLGYTAESYDSAFFTMPASSYDDFIQKSLTAIIVLMAVILYAFVFGSPVTDILISAVIGALILVIVRGNVKPVSRT